MSDVNVMVVVESVGIIHDNLHKIRDVAMTFLWNDRTADKGVRCCI